jgi:glutamate 5-kinase
LKPPEKKYKRIVIKIGSSLFYSRKKPEILKIFEIVSGVSALRQTYQKELVIVSSGAIALGMNLLGLKSRPKDLPTLQAAAALGQNELMDNYSRFFKRYNIKCAQILLTWDDFRDRQRYLNAKNTLLELLKLGAIPIINENDSVSTEEIKFGDNDKLSALVANLINADLLVILSDIEGLLDNKRRLIRIVDEITPEIKSLAGPADKKTSVGGMITKIEAAKIAMDSGIPCIITSGKIKNIILSVVRNPERYGTLFIPKKGFKARERWIAFGTKTKGKIIVDDGAKAALKNKKSLLSVGVISLAGEFASGDIISIVDKQGYEFARGKARLSSKQLEEVKGRRFEKEVVHCDNIVIL